MCWEPELEELRRREALARRMGGEERVARQRELAAIVANQATVAIRNARLYSQVPLAGALGALGARRKALLEVPRRRRAVYAATLLAVVGALTAAAVVLPSPGGAAGAAARTPGSS